MLSTAGPAFVGSPEKVPYSEIYNESGAAMGQVLQAHPLLVSVWFRTQNVFTISSVGSEDNPSEARVSPPHSFCGSSKL